MKLSFGKKGGGEKKAKPTKRKAKGNGADPVAQVKALATQHVEKVVLAIIGLASLWIVYSGFKQEGLGDNAQPNAVRQAITNAQSTINRDTWSQVRPQRHPEPDSFDSQATADTENLIAADYALPMPFHPILKEQEKRRTDPPMLAPIELEVRAGYGPLAVRDVPGASGATGNVSGFFSEGTRSNEGTRALPDKYREKMRGEISMSGGTTESRYFVSITGLVPYKEQLEAYKEAFLGAADFTAERDTPRYLALGIERADVAADGSLGEWTNLDTLTAMRVEPQIWENSNEERVSREYLVPGLVMPIPPLLFRDLNQWATHSKIPVEEASERGAVSERALQEEDFDRGGDATDLFGGANQFREGGDRDARAEEDSGDYAESPEDAIETLIKVDHGLLRYFDFSVEPGKQYAYRVRLLLEDPNNPRESRRPPVSACETSVLVRRQENPSKNFRESPWSEPTAAVVVPSGRSVFAGTVEAPRAYPLPGNSRIRLPRRPGEEPVVSLMAVAWDKTTAMDVPALLQVRRGAVVNASMTTEAVDPARANIVTLPDYQLSTDLMVLDIAGGEPVGGRGNDLIRSPGLVLIMNLDGQIKLHDEMSDYERFDFFSIPEDEEAAIMRDAELRAEEPAEENTNREEVRGMEEGGEGRRGRNR